MCKNFTFKKSVSHRELKKFKLISEGKNVQKNKNVSSLTNVIACKIFK